MKDIKKEKISLRNLIKNKRAQFNIEDFRKIDKDIVDKILQSEEFTKAKTIMAYYPINSEIDIRPVLSKVLEDKKTLLLPYCYMGGKMDAKLVKSLQELETSRFSIPSPKATCPSISKNQIDLILVPSLAASHNGQRLGYGGGYYDRFLQDFEIEKCILLARESEIIHYIPQENTDISFTKILTQNGILRI